VNQDLEQLKAIVAGPDYDPESREVVAELEKQFEEAVQSEKLLAIPSVVKYVEHIEREIEQCKELLSEQTMKLTDHQRIQLHERKEINRDFLMFFKPQRHVEKTIKQHLDAVQGKGAITTSENPA
jgi:hypothetical protein